MDRVAASPGITLAYFGLALLAMRIVRGWNQTGQKHAGEPDLIKIFLLPRPQLLWVLVCSTYLWLAQQIFVHLRSVPAIASGAVAAGLAFSAFSFKVAFATEDAPELVVGLVKDINDLLQGPSLVMRARVVFMGMAVIAGVAVYRKVRSSQRVNGTSGEFSIS